MIARRSRVLELAAGRGAQSIATRFGKCGGSIWGYMAMGYLVPSGVIFSVFSQLGATATTVTLTMQPSILIAYEIIIPPACKRDWEMYNRGRFSIFGCWEEIIFTPQFALHLNMGQNGVPNGPPNWSYFWTRKKLKPSNLGGQILRHAHFTSPFHQLDLPSGNQTWQWKIPH